MSDNFPQTPGSGRNVASDEVSYSGDTADVQLQRPVHVTGSEGSKTVVPITDADGQFVQGSVAHDDADSGKAVKIGGKALVSSEETPTVVAEGDRTNAWFERDGALVTGHREAPRQDATWNSGTSLDAAITIDVNRMGGAIAWIVPSGSITAGALTFECSVNGGSTFVPLSGTNGNRMQIGVILTGADYWNGAEAGWRFHAGSMDRIRIRLSTQITGGGSVTVSLRATTAVLGNSMVARHQFRQLASTVTSTGTDSFDLEGTQGSPSLTITNSGSAWSGTIVFEMSPDGSNWYPAIGLNVNTYAGIEFQTTANGSWVFSAIAGMRYIRVRGATVTNTAGIFWSVGTVGAAVVFAIGGGDKAHDATDLNTFPVKIGARAIAHGANPTAVAADDRTNLYANRHGIPWMLGGHPNIVTYEYTTTASRTDDPVLPVIGSGLKYVITQIQAVTDGDCSVNPGCRIGFGTANVPASGGDGADGVAGVVLSHPGIPPGGGPSRGDGSGIVAVGGDGSDLRVTCDAPTGGSLVITVSAFTIES